MIKINGNNSIEFNVPTKVALPTVDLVDGMVCLVSEDTTYGGIYLVRSGTWVQVIKFVGY